MQFDVYRWRGQLLVDCQADTLSELESRLVVPLLEPTGIPSFPRMIPKVSVEGSAYIVGAHLMTAVPMRELGQPIGSLAQHRYDILGAIDLLVTGY